MDKAEALSLVSEELVKLRACSYSELSSLAEKPKRTFRVTGATGAKYIVDIMVYWDDKPGGNVRVIGAIDDGGWRAFVPLTRGFIKAADESYVDE